MDNNIPQLDLDGGDSGGNGFKIPIIVAIVAVMILVVSVLPAINFGINGGNNWNVLAATSYLNSAGYAVWATGGLTAGEVPVAQVDGTLATDSGLAYNSTTDTLTTTNLVAPTGGTTYFIAATGASSFDKAHANAECDGTNDEVQINAGIAVAEHVVLSAGTFTLGSSIVPVNETWLQGQGYSTIITGANKSIDITSVSNVTVDSLQLSGADTYTDGIYVSAGTKSTIQNCYIHDYTTNGINLNTTTANSYDGLTIINNYIYDIADYTTAVTGNGILLSSGSEYTDISHNHINRCGTGINNAANNSKADSNDVGTNYQGIVSTGARFHIVDNTINHCTTYGISLSASNGVLMTGNTICHSGNEGFAIYSNCHGLSCIGNNIFSNGDLNSNDSHDSEIRLNVTGVLDGIIANNSIGYVTDANAKTGIYFVNAAQTKTVVTDNIFNNSGGVTTYVAGWKDTMGEFSGNINYITTGEIRTYSGTIATLTENAFNSIDNPFGQAVRVLSLDIYITTASGDTTPNATIDCGIGDSATTDYTTLFEGIDCETTGFSNSVNTATIGKQTSPQLWATGSGNRYLNMSIKDAAATNMVATYTITIMGN